MQREDIIKIRDRYQDIDRIEETHISWALLGNEFVYKIKKPIRLRHLDFSTLKKRKHFCEEEVRLNARLSPEIYCGAVPITLEVDRYVLEGKGKPVEYSVKMKRLPDDSRLDKLIASGKTAAKDIQDIATTAAIFHDRAAIIDDPYYGSTKDLMERNHEMHMVKDTIEEVSGRGEQLEHTLDWIDHFIDINRDEIIYRQSRGKIRECHGDFRTRNIFLTDRPIILNCIEFSKELRCKDVLWDIAWLAMDLESRNRYDLSEALIKEYNSKSGEPEETQLMTIYKCILSNVMAKVAAIAYRQGLSETTKEDMIKFLDLTEGYIQKI